MVETIYCVHCGAVAKHPVYKVINGQSLSFCCGGCVQVYELMHEMGLEAGPGAGDSPRPNAPKPVRSASAQTISVHVAGMTCANCVAAVGRALRSVAGVLEVSVDLETELAVIQTNPGIALKDLQRAVEKAGYQLSKPADV